MKLLATPKYNINLAAIITFLIAFIFVALAPRDWATTHSAQVFISFIASIVPAMEKLRHAVPHGCEYMALTGATIWALLPLYFCMILLMNLSNSDYTKDCDTWIRKVSLKQKEVIYWLFGMPALITFFAYSSLITLWTEFHYSARGFWLDMTSTNIMAQLATWTFIGLMEYLAIFLLFAYIRFLVVKLKKD